MNPPSKNELDLGKSLVIEFTSQHLPSEIDRVYSIFRARGAYSLFKSILEEHDEIDNWYKYEQAAQREALLQWCSINGIKVDI